LGAVVLFVSACTTTGVVGYPAEYIDTHGPSHVWVTGSDNAVVELSNPHVQGDTLAGFANGNYVEMRLEDVKLMKANFPSPGRTALLAGVTAIGAALAVAALMGNNSSTTTCYDRTTGGTMPCPPPA
jgi:hypothetical protein